MKFDSAERGNALGLWHVLVHNEHLVFAGEAQARAAVAAYLRAARESHRLESGTRRGARRLHPPAKLRDGASGRSYRGPAAGMHWETDTLSVRYVRLYRRTEQMEHGRRAGRAALGVGRAAGRAGGSASETGARKGHEKGSMAQNPL